MANRSFLTLLLVLAIAHFAPVAIPGANALQGMNLAPPAVVRRTEHHQMAGRMLKKRQTRAATATDTGVPTNTGTTGNAQPTGSGTTNNPNGQSSTGSTSTPTQNSTTDTNTRSTSSTSTSTTPSTTSTPPATTSTPTTPPPSNASSTSTRRTATFTQTQTSAAATQSDQSSDPDASFLPKPAIIGLIVTGSCIAAAAAIWTIIRKWKFSPSRHFEDRLEPINWEPTQSSGLPHDPTVAALNRGASQSGRTRNSLSSDGHGSVRNMSTANNDQVSMAPDFPPPHDFTAGAANLAPPSGYVDMYRGPSPGPNPYAQRGPSPAPSGPYGQQYETPNPYDAYDYNSGYGQRRY